MGFVLVCTVKDLRRRIADPVSLLIWVGIPILLGSLLMMISSGNSGGTPTAHLLVVDQDDSLISGLLTGLSGQQAVGDFLQIETVDLQQGRARLDAGDGSALLIIPEGFGDAVLLEKPTELTLITNPAQRILPGIIEEGLEILVQAAFYGQRLVGPQLRTALQSESVQDEGPSLEQVTRIATETHERIEAIAPMLSPPVLKLAQEPEAEEAQADDTDNGTGFNIVQVFLPAMLFMSVLFVAQGMSDDLWKEADHGTLRRLLTSPRRLAQMLAGKLLAGTIIMAVLAGIAMPLAWWLVGVAAARLPLALVWCAFAGSALLAYFFLIQSMAGSQRSASVLSTLMVFPLMMLGGSFFPFAAMPDWMAAIGRWTPNGLALVQLEQILWGSVDPAALIRGAASIGIPAAAAFALCAWRMRTGPLGRA